jgi:hypothetical protein
MVDKRIVNIKALDLQGFREVAEENDFVLLEKTE